MFSFAQQLMRSADKQNDIVSDEFKGIIQTMEYRGERLRDTDFLLAFRGFLGDDKTGQRHLHNHLLYVLQSNVIVNVGQYFHGAGSALRLAVQRACSICTSLLLNAGADPNLVDVHFKNTPLHDAAQCRMGATCVKLLLERGANVSAVNSAGRQPLHYAAHCTIVECLINAGADVNARDSRGDTVLLLTTVLRHVDIDNIVTLMQLLIGHGANIDARGQRGFSPLHNCILYTFQFSDTYQSWQSGLRMLAMLISNGAPIVNPPNVDNAAFCANWRRAM